MVATSSSREHDMSNRLGAVLLAGAHQHALRFKAEAATILRCPADELLRRAPCSARGMERGVGPRPVLLEEGLVVAVHGLLGTRTSGRWRCRTAPSHRCCECHDSPGGSPPDSHHELRIAPLRDRYYPG